MPVGGEDPLRLPRTLGSAAADVGGRFLLRRVEQLCGDIPQEAGRHIACGLSVQHAAACAGQIQALARPRNADIAEPPLLFHFGRVVNRSHAGKYAVLHAGQKDDGKFQSLRGMHGHHHDGICRAVHVVGVGHQRHFLQKARERRHIVGTVALIILNGRRKLAEVIHPLLLLRSRLLPHGEIAGLCQHGGVQGVKRSVGIIRKLPQTVDQGEKLPQLSGGAGDGGVVLGMAQHLIQAGVGSLGDLSGVIQCRGADRAARYVDDTAQADAVLGILDDPQIRHGVADLQIVEEAVSADNAVGNAAFDKCPLNGVGLCVGAVEHCEIAEAASAAHAV